MTRDETDTAALFTFSVSTVQLAIPAEAVERVIEDQSVVPLPHTPEHILGLVGYHRRTIVVVDVAAFFGIKQDRGGRDEEELQIVVVQCGELEAGFRVSRAKGVTHVRREALLAPNLIQNSRVQEVLDSEFIRDSEPTGCLVVPKLLEAMRG